MLQINGKTFMNLQEAVAWLLANNALPFQCNVNYVANTEIAKTAIINPSPAEIKVGALVLFADSKIGTISGLTSNGFMVGSEYTDIRNSLAYITNVVVANDAHLYVQFSDGVQTDAGLIKEVTSFEIDASQHLIVHYNTGASDDLGAIFSGNVNISGNLSVTGDCTISGAQSVTGDCTSSSKFDAPLITGDEIIEKMSGYSFDKKSSTADTTLEYVYAGAVKNGNKLTLVLALNITKIQDEQLYIGDFIIPATVGANLYPVNIGGYDYLSYNVANGTDAFIYVVKISNTTIRVVAITNNLSVGKHYSRIELTYLLSENLAS